MSNSALLPQAFSTPHRGILYPTDFSKDSFVAFDHALRIALQFKAPLDLTHAEPKNDQAPARWYPEVLPTLKKWEVLSPTATETDVAELGLTWRRTVQVGKPATEAILTELDQHPADLVVLTTYNREGVQRVLYGNVAEPLMRKAHVPILVLPPKARRFVSEYGELELARILVPTALEPDPQVAVDYAASFARGMGVQDLELATLFAGDARKAPKIFFPEDQGWHIRNWTGGQSPVDEIVTTAKSWKANLVIMTSEGRHGIADQLFGSTVEQVLHRIDCPVLILPILRP